MKSFVNKHRRWLLPVAVIVVAYGIATVIRNSGPVVEVVEPEPQELVVRAVTAAPESVQLVVRSQGEVSSRYMIELVNELAGQVAEVSPAFVAGGYFDEGDVLLRIDPTDYRLAVIRAEATVAEAAEELVIEESEAELAAQGLFPLREAKVASAKARLQSAEAELAQAKADLARTEVRAPFAGRVLVKDVDLGQYLSTGQSLGRIYSTDIAEIRVPLTDEQLLELDLPFGAGPDQPFPDTPVTVRTSIGNEEHSWNGYVHRMEGAVDRDSRVWYGVVRVNDPYGLESEAAVTPLALGLFVEVDISGKEVADVFPLPRSALRNKDQLLIIDSEGRMHSRKVGVLRTDFDTVLISEGIAPGEQVCVSPVEVFVEGLPVAIAETPDMLAEN